ncbi:class F sortase [Glycomyces harbinensis]|uniref:Sortase family protein n=1 Tax=Glycomyces harbinensis TaxID=58114 RepID=A0A1G6ZCC1_9ACTN|nr:class F sortase [Glycomyces harbinensis]SDE00364.1 Sortase family protein [Glycomyces harbinensis]
MEPGTDVDDTGETLHRPEPAFRPVAAVVLSILLAGGLGLMVGGVAPLPTLSMPEFANPFDDDPFALADPAGGDWLDRSDPTRVDIPSVDVHAPLTALGLDYRGNFEVPASWRPHEAGWFEPGPTPGEFGPTVLMGHVDTERSGPAVFYPVGRLEAGDAIEVTREDGIVVSYEVTEVESYAKKRLPYEDVFGIEAAPALRLITCGGEFDRESGDYTENVVVFAEYTGHRRATEQDLDRPLNGREHFKD